MTSQLDQDIKHVWLHSEVLDGCVYFLLDSMSCALTIIEY